VTVTESQTKDVVTTILSAPSTSQMNIATPHAFISFYPSLTASSTTVYRSPFPNDKNPLTDFYRELYPLYHDDTKHEEAEATNVTPTPPTWRSPPCQKGVGLFVWNNKRWPATRLGDLTETLHSVDLLYLCVSPGCLC
jgi:hypothetical protein